MKKKIFFVPNYIGTLRYYEKLFPRLGYNFDCEFVFISPNPIWLKTMIAYCEQKQYRYVVIDDDIKGWRVPFVTALKKHRILFSHCREFLRTEKPVKIISMENDKLYLTQALFAEANAKGIETIVLQWALNAYDNPRIVEAASKLKPENISFPKRLYFLILRYVGLVLGIYNTSAKILQRSSPVKVGIINEQARKAYLAQGYPKDRIQVVGHADCQLVEVVMRKFRTEPEFRKEVCEKYRVSPKKKNIVVISTMFNRKDIRVLTDSEQVKYYRTMFNEIRSVFPESEYSILFKLHPSERNLYEHETNLGVVVLPDSAEIVEVVALADLYIAHPHTAVNLMAISARKQAIFVNFLNFDYFNLVREYYGITNIVISHEEFVQFLSDSYRGKLKLQYEPMAGAEHSLDRIVDFINS